MTTIIGLKMQTGLETAPQLQAILSNYACAIRTRIGVHDTCNNKCENFGIILLQISNDNIITHLQDDILKISGIEMQVMKFN